MKASTRLLRLHRVASPRSTDLLLSSGTSILGGVVQVGLMAAIGYLLAWSALRPSLGEIGGLLAGVELLAFLRSPLRYADRLQGHAVAFRALTKWRVWLFDLLVPLSPAGMVRRSTGDLLATAIADVETLQDLYIRSLLPLTGILAPLLVVVIVLGIVVPLAGVIALLVVILCVIIQLLGNRQGGEAALTKAQRNGDLTALLVDAVAGAQALSTSDAWGPTIAKAAALRRQMTALKAAERRRSAFRATSLGIGGLGLILCGLFAASHALSTSHFDVRLAAALVFATMASVELLSGLGQALVAFEQIGAAAARLGDVEDLIPPPATGTIELERTAPLTLEMEQATLQYPMATHRAIDQLTLSIPSGQTLALVGPSGSGKSSVLVALLGLWPLESGVVTINGLALRDLDHSSIRGAVGTHLGAASLFSGTVRSNLMSAGADEATMSSVLTSLGLVPADAFLDRLVGERGQNLSGGERQRVSLARALLSARAALFIDEPDAHLDEEAAALVTEAIMEASLNVTTILCSHRVPDGSIDLVVQLRSGSRIL